MKLLISDLDGTLYPIKSVNQTKQLQNNLEAVKKWVSLGNKFAVATARGIWHNHEITKMLGFKVNYIGCNGASVVLENNEQIIKQFPCKVFIDLCRFVQEKNINASVVTGINDEWVWSSKACYPIRNATEIQPNWDSIKVADLIQLDPTLGIERIQILVLPKERDDLKRQLEELNLQVIITTSDIDMIDIGPLNSSKGISILELCQRYHIKHEDLIVVGDSANDVPMFEITENSYCIVHADDHVFEKAKFQVKTVQEVIEKELKKDNRESIIR